MSDKAKITYASLAAFVLLASVVSCQILRTQAERDRAERFERQGEIMMDMMDRVILHGEAGW